jgi:hypothetical protein
MCRARRDASPRPPGKSKYVNVSLCIGFSSVKEKKQRSEYFADTKARRGAVSSRGSWLSSHRRRH